MNWKHHYIVHIEEGGDYEITKRSLRYNQEIDNIETKSEIISIQTDMHVAIKLIENLNKQISDNEYLYADERKRNA
jgi:hypothetical protein